MYTLYDIFFLFLFVLIGLYWWRLQAVKEKALQSTRAYCENMGVDLLDDGLVLKGFWWKRDSQGRVRVWRSYWFEFSSTGNDRYRGRTVVLGDRVEHIQLDPHRLH